MSRVPPCTVAAAAACLVLAATGSAAAATAGPTPATLRDIAGDANALNDQGEGLVGNVRTGQQLDQADLRSITIAALPSRNPSNAGLRISFTTTARPAPLADGTPLAYGVLLEPRRDCRMTVEFVTARSTRLAGSAGPSGVLVHTCADGQHSEVALPARLVGRTATVDVPYGLLPPAARGAQGDAVAYVRTAPTVSSHARPVELDSAR